MIALDALSTREALRVKCLELALAGDFVGRAPDTVVQRAKAFEAFVRGEEEK